MFVLISSNPGHRQKLNRRQLDSLVVKNISSLIQKGFNFLDQEKPFANEARSRPTMNYYDLLTSCMKFD